MKWTMTTRPMTMEQMTRRKAWSFLHAPMRRRAFELHFHNAPISTQSALKWGLVNRIFPSTSFMQKTLAYET